MITIVHAKDHLEELQRLSLAESIISPDSSLVYVARQNMGLRIKRSPLANPFSLRQHGGDRDVVCDRFRDERIAPALQSQAGPLWNTLDKLADRVRNGDRLKYACWCCSEENPDRPQQRCHAQDLRTATLAIANPEKYYLPIQLKLL